MTSETLGLVLLAALVVSWFVAPQWLHAIITAAVVANTSHFWVGDISTRGQLLVIVPTFVGVLSVLTFLDELRGYSTILHPHRRPPENSAD